MANRDLFKEAIAEAKSIREAAILNAKEALEESLTPHLKSMLAAKLQEMEEAEDLEEMKHDDEMDETVEEAMHEDEMDEAQATEAEDDSEESEDEAEEEAEGEEEEAGEEEEMEAEDEDVEVADMEVEDLKALIRDLIQQEMEPMEDEMAADMEVDADMEAGEEAPMDMVTADEEGEEEIDLAELLAELEALDEEEEMDEAQGNIDAHEENPHDQLQEDLKEAIETINTLKAELAEVNLLNAKLLYVNKVFRNNNLNEDQKVKIIASFDKAETVKEVKLVFDTVKDSLVSEAAKPAKKVVREHKSFASKATGNAPKPAEVVPMVNEQVLRMQKLAGIIK